MSEPKPDIVARLRKWDAFWGESLVAADEIERLRAELAAAIKERDEAQREVCEMIARTRRKAGIRGSTVGLDRVAPEAIAAERGWDCYAQEGGGA